MFAKSLREAKVVESLIETQKQEYLASLPKCAVKFIDDLKLGEFLISNKELLLIGTVDTSLEVARIYNILQQHYNTNKNPTSSDNIWYESGLTVMELRKPLERFLGSYNQTFLDWDISKKFLKKANDLVNFTNLVVIEFSTQLENKESIMADLHYLMDRILADSRKIILIYPGTGKADSQPPRDMFKNNSFKMVAKEVFDISFSHLTKDSQRQILTQPLFMFKGEPMTLSEFLQIDDCDNLSDERIKRLNQIINSKILKEISGQNFTPKEISIYFYSPELCDLNPAYLNIFRKLSLNDITLIFKNIRSTSRELEKPVHFFVNCPRHLQEKIVTSLDIDGTSKNDDFFLVFGSEVNASEIEFVQFCKNHPDDRIYWITSNNDCFFCMKVYDLNFYIQRRFLGHIALKPEVKSVFRNKCPVPDLFVFDNMTDKKTLIDFLGISNKEFEKLRRSGNVVVLEDGEERFNLEMERNIERPVHVIRFDESNMFFWIKSLGSLEKLRNFVSVEDVQVDELEVSKRKVVVLGGTAGGGKFSSLVGLLRHIPSTSCIIKINLKNCQNAIKKIPSVINTDDAVGVLSINYQDNPFVPLLLADILSNNTRPLYFLFEKFDELLDNLECDKNSTKPFEIQKIGKLLVFLKNNANVHIWISSNRYTGLLENMLSVFNTRIVEISTYDQKEFLVNSWLSKIVLGCDLFLEEQKQLLQEHVEETITAMQSIFKPFLKLVGEPFQLGVIQAVAQPSMDYSTKKFVYATEYHNISNIFKQFLQIKYAQYFEKFFKTFQKNIQSDRTDFQAYQDLFFGSVAFKQICPASVQTLEAYGYTDFKLDVCDETKAFLRSIEEGHGPKFVSGLFAEYFAAILIANWLSNPKYLIAELLLSEILIKPRHKLLRLLLNNIIDAATMSPAASKSFAEHISRYCQGKAKNDGNQSQHLIFHTVVQEDLNNIAQLFFNKHFSSSKVLVSFFAARDKFGKTALFSAAEQRSEVIVDDILQCFNSGTIQHQQRLFYSTLLGGAALKDRLTAEYLLNKMKNTKWKKNLSYEELKEKQQLVVSLLEAVRKNDLNRLKKLIKRVGNEIACYYVILWTDDDGLTILHLAASKGYVDIVRYLLTHNISVDLLDQHGATPLHHASKTGSLDVVELLKEHGSNCDILDSNGLSPLAVSAKYGHFKVVESLIKYGACSKELDKTNISPLEYASAGGHLELVKLLIGQGSDVNHQDATGMTAIAWAVNAGHSNVAEYLVKNKTNLSLLDSYGRNILQIAIEFKQWHLVKYLIFCGINVNTLNYNLVSSLQIAITMRNWDIAELLISEGAEINIVDQDKLTPIWYAAQAKKWSLVVHMVEKKAEIVDLPLKVRQKILNYTILNNNVVPKPPSDSNKLYNAFYNVIRLGNVDLLHMLIEREHLNDNSGSENLAQLLAEPYEELHLRNVPLADKMKYFIEEKLVLLRGFSHVSRKNSNKQENVIKRIEMTKNRIKIVREKYSRKGAPKVDQEFIIYIQYIAENIEVLKRDLKHTYDSVPWEEMEFCLAIFITLFLKPSDDDFPYRLVIDQNRILMHLGNFDKTLANIKYISGIYNTDFSNDKRLKNIKEINEKYPDITSLFEDYNIIKDIYSLKRISSFTKVALSVKKTEENDIGPYAVQRCLQAIGESFKNTCESPNLSEDVHNYLMYFAPKNVKRILTMLRNNLSHSYTIKERLEIENRLRNDMEFLESVQNDLRKIQADVVDILSRKKHEAVTMFWTKIKNSNSIDDVKQLTRYIEFHALSNLDQDDYETVEYKKLKSLLLELNDHVQDMTDSDKAQLTKILDDMSKSRSDALKRQYFSNEIIINSLIKTESFVTLNNVATVHLNFKRRIEKNHILTDTISNFIAPIYNSLKESSLCYSIGMILRLINKNSKIQHIEKIKVEKKSRKNKIIYWNERYTIKYFKTTINLPENKDKLNDNKKLINNLKKNWNRQNASSPNLRRFVEQLGITQATKNQLLKTIDDDDQEHSCIQLNIQEKLNILQRILQTNVNLFKTDKVIVSAIEILSLDVIDWLLTTLQLPQHTTYFADYSPVLVGKSLRNYLAHGGCLIDALPFSPLTSVLATIQEILKNDSYLLNNKTISEDKIVVDTINDRFNIMINIAMTQSCIFQNFREGKLNQGDETRATDIYGATSLEYVIMSNNVLSTEYFLKKENKSITLSFLAAVKLGCLDIINHMSEFVRNSTILSKSVLIAAGNGHKDVLLKLLDLGADVDNNDRYQMTPLDVAIENGYNDIVVSLLETNSGTIKSIALDFAAIKGYKDVIATLVKHGIFQNMHNEAKLHTLCVAAQNGHKDVVSILLKCNVDVNAYWKGDTTALHVAANAGHTEVVEILLDYGADINAEETFDTGGTPLHVACQNGYNDVSQLLIKRGAKVNAKNANNVTALHMAAECGHKDIIHNLLHHGADVNAKTIKNLTPLHTAVGSNDKDIIEILVSRGAQINAKDKEGSTALHTAAFNGYDDVVISLINNGADHKAKSVGGWTPLQAAALNGHQQVVMCLLNEGANIHAENNTGETALVVAAHNNHNNVVSALLDHDANINGKDKEGSTALFQAAYKGFKEVVETLLKKDADVQVQRKDRSTSLDVAVQNGHKDIVEMLLDHKAKVNGMHADRRTPLQTAAEYNHIDIVNMLIARGALINDLRSTEPSALHLAVQNRCLEVVNILLDRGADVNAKGKNKWSALHIAALHGYDEIALTLLEKGANVNAIEIDSWTALHLAAQNGHVNVVKCLLEHGVCVNANDTVSPLYQAAGHGHDEVVRYLLDYGATVDVEHKHTPLFVAAQYGHSKVVQNLLNHGADPNFREKECQGTGLHMAAARCHMEVLLVLLNHGADINCINKDKCTALHAAAQHGHREIVIALLDHGADIEAKTNEGCSALYIAADYGHTEIVTTLLNRGANINAKGKKQFTALHVAAANGHEKTVANLLARGADVNATGINPMTPLVVATSSGSKNIVRHLLDYGANVNAKDEKNLTSLYISAITGHTDILAILLERGADVNAANDDGGTALYSAIANGHEEVVEYLLDKGANVNLGDKMGRSALYLAVSKGKDGIATTLLNNGATVNARAKSKWAPLHIAACQGYTDIVRTLLRYGADINAVRDPTNNTALHLAACNGHRDIALVLLEQGANVNLMNSKKHFPLFYAAQMGRREIVLALIKHGAPINAGNENEMVSALFVAVANNHGGTVQDLVSHGANVNIVDKLRRTPLHMAVVRGHLGNVLELINHGANVNVLSSRNETPLYLAVSGGFLKIMAVLLENGALY